MTKRRTKPRPSKTRAATRPRSGNGQTWRIAAIVLVVLVALGAGLWLIRARPGQSATASVSQFQQIKDLGQLPPGRTERVEVAYFHRTQRCSSCIEAERLTRKTLDAYFADRLKSGEMSLVVTDVQKPQNAALVQKYDAYGPSLYLGTIKDGIEYIWPVSDIWFALSDEPKFMALLRDRINIAYGGR
ncbi:MAG: nitrophenyl compound nitroreductase subunit ArsF family protein [Anaerolineae bacterium]